MNDNIPKKLSADKRHPYFNDEWCQRVAVLKDGIEIKNVVTVDTVNGWAIIERTDENGKAVLSPDGQEIVRDIINGNFELKRIR